MTTPSTASAATLLQNAVSAIYRPVIGVSAISCIVNVLVLTGPMFMMQVNSRVLSSKSLESLAALSLLALALYVFYGVLEALRGKLMARIGTAFDHRLAPKLFDATLRLPLHLGAHARNHDPLRDLAAIRNFLMGTGPIALLDIPWIPIYFGFLFFLHPLLGMAAAGGALFLIVLAIANQLVSRGSTKSANQMHAQMQAMLFDAKRNAEAAAAMSMGDDLCKRWGAGYIGSIANSRDLADHASIFGAISKTSRLALQSGMLALGAYLVIDGSMSPGGMFAGSIILSRALAPIDQVIGQWRGISFAWQAYRRLRLLAARLPEIIERQHSMPRPSSSLTVRDVAVVAPGGNSAIVSGVSFELEAGDALGIIGPSGCGKSTLIRSLVGAWPTAVGEVRYDQALIAQYSPVALGEAIGHLPQSIELFDGTIAENIARFRKEATTAEVVEAAKLAGVHEMILGFKQGYDTPVGEGGASLSGGQRQRIGLARAVFGNPFLVVLDEPNSNLDPLGEQSLNEAIQRMRSKGRIVVIVAHRPSAIFAANKILSLRNGKAEMFGPKKHVLASLFPRAGQPQKPVPAAPETATAATAAEHAPANPQAAAADRPAAEWSSPRPTDGLSATSNVAVLDRTRSRRA